MCKAIHASSCYPRRHLLLCLNTSRKRIKEVADVRGKQTVRPPLKRRRLTPLLCFIANINFLFVQRFSTTIKTPIPFFSFLAQSKITRKRERVWSWCGALFLLWNYDRDKRACFSETTMRVNVPFKSRFVAQMSLRWQLRRRLTLVFFHPYDREKQMWRCHD